MRSRRFDEQVPRAAADNRVTNCVLTLAFLTASLAPAAATWAAKPPKPLDRESPGDEMIQAWLGKEALRLDGQFMASIQSAEDWNKARPEFKREYLYMLGLWPLPEKTPLKPVVTRMLDQGDYAVEMIHYQSKPGLYVTANLYRPATIAPGQRLPAVLYVCGHGRVPRDGNKTGYQSNGIWFAKHGYICLAVDTLQLGEISSIHHGTYSEGRWWWHSRGYTPAGVECWNGVRGIDYLISRPDVDADRLAVTGLSGGGAATFWVAAADERVKAAVAISGMSDLKCYVPGALVNSHCDCMFMYNVFQWPWTRIAALVAPRPLLFVNSDQDRIFPMDGNERIINRLERMYSLFGAGDMVDSLVSIGGHAYRKDIRQATYRFINTHLKGDPAIVQDSEEDIITGEDDQRVFPIPTAKLRVFPQDSDIPADAINAHADETFVPMAVVQPPAPGRFKKWRESMVAELRRVTFHCFPESIPPAQMLDQRADGSMRMKSEEGIEFRLARVGGNAAPSERALLVVRNADEAQGLQVPGWAATIGKPGDALYLCDPRGIGETRWTSKNPPNYVERAHPLVGRTVDTSRVWDVIAAAAYIREQTGAAVIVAGEKSAGILAAYAALLEPGIASAIVVAPPVSHMDPAAPQFLNVLRVCDVPQVLGMLGAGRLQLIDVPHSLTAEAQRFAEPRP